MAIGFLACSNNNNQPLRPPAIHRALISNFTNSNITVADTDRDVLSTVVGSFSNSPGLMVLSNDRKLTVAYGPVDNSVTVINNTLQSGGGSARLADPNSLPNACVSVTISPDNGTILGAIPNEVVFGQAPGAIDVVTAATNGALSRQPSIPLVGVRYLYPIPNGNRVVAMSDTAPNPVNPPGPSGRVWIVTPSLIGSGTQPYTEVASALFDHPVFAIGSADNTSAYVLNCGPECGGAQAGIVTVDLTNDTASLTALPVPAGSTVALLNGSMLYVAGSVGLVGSVTPVDLVTSTLSPPIPIADGYHDRIALGSNNVLFVGARGCMPTAGCLTLVSNPNTASQKITIAPRAPFKFPAPDPGDDVTGIAPIQNRNEVYVIQGGELIIYDTTTMLRKVQDNPPDIVGQAIDVVGLD
jgi:hypothetical protein